MNAEPHGTAARSPSTREDLTDPQFVIKVVTENDAAKLATFRAFDPIVSNENAILASNTSLILIMNLTMATSRPERVIRLKSFNPVPVLQLVEVITSLLTGA